MKILGKFAVAALASSISLIAQGADVEGPDLYGKWNVSIQKNRVTDFTGHTSSVDGSRTRNDWDIQSNNSRIGVKGNAPLYNEDVKAIYQFEWEVDSVDERSAAGGNTFRTRNSFVGLDSPLGRFFVGTYDSPTKKTESRFDQFNDSEADLGNIAEGQNRYSNTINWVSQGMGPVEFRAQVIPGESRRTSPDRHVIIGNGAPLVKDEEGLAEGLSVAALFKQDNFQAGVSWEENSETLNGATIATLSGANSFDRAATPTVPALGNTEFSANSRILRGFVGVNAGGVELNALLQRRHIGIGSLDSTYTRGVSGKFELNHRTSLKGQFVESEDAFMGVRNDGRMARQTTFGADHKLGKATTAYTFFSAVEVSGRDALRRSDGTEERYAVVGMIHKF